MTPEAFQLASRLGTVLPRSIDRLSSGLALADGRLLRPFDLTSGPARIARERSAREAAREVARAEQAVIWLRDRTLRLDGDGARRACAEHP